MKAPCFVSKIRLGEKFYPLLTKTDNIVIILHGEKMRKFFLLLMMVFLLFTSVGWGQTGFTQRDRELLIELKTRIYEIDKRFEQVDKRFEQVDIRLKELREDMNNRFGQMMSFILILAGIFGAMTAATIGFALWDRKTMIRPFETKVAAINEKIKINQETNQNLIAALKDYAQKDRRFADVLKRFNLF